jgi:alginate O-acetyltransferase complex protein AlgI
MQASAGNTHGSSVVFDTQPFLIFFPLFFVLYHALRHHLRTQNLLIVIGSFIFYGWWNVRFLALLATTAGADYLAGLLLDEKRNLPTRTRKLVLATSLTINLGLLAVFKYYDFFIGSANAALHSLGLEGFHLLKIVLPVGISFYTFQSISYAVDVYRKDADAEYNPITYFAFVCFFPHMVAGPIQRPRHLLSQLNRKRELTASLAAQAAWLLIYGYFLKVFVANGTSTLTDAAFAVDQRSGWTTLLGTLAFAVQIYSDFLGYSLIARGTGLALGVEFIWNFNQPYVATSLRDFWRRWHISLSSWLRDYLYIPLGGSHGGLFRTQCNLILTMVLGGLWHGAGWNYVLWGFWHGAVQAGEKLARERVPALRPPPALAWVLTMSAVLFGWLLFRCRSMAMIVGMLGSFSDMHWLPVHTHVARNLIILTTPLLCIEVWQRRRNDLLVPLRLHPLSFGLLCGLMLAITVVLFERLRNVFIYFQF